LQHEFKHAFDEWIRRIKNITSSSEDIKYFTNKRLLSKTGLNSLWKDFFTSTHYLYSKYEKTAHQQEMLHFYRNTALGKLFIKTLKKIKSLGMMAGIALDLDTDIESRPAAKCLKQSLFDYVSGPEFNPEYELDRKMLKTVLSCK
jgi:hypothetical protein